MTAENQHDSCPDGDRDPSEERVAELLCGYLERLNAGEQLDEQTIRSEHPELAEELLAELRMLEMVPSDTVRSAPLGTLGDYTLRRQIGRGGMGIVYEAWENSMDRPVALKILPAGVAADDKAFNRFMREARTAGKLSHSNIVPVFGVGIKERTPYFAMEFIEGETLAQVLARIKEADDEAETPFGPRERQDYFVRLGAGFAEVADGLQHAHSKGVVHRDIKPSNLILDSEGRLRILDFGLARLEGQESLTISGDVVGTPLYMSPEQARRKRIRVDHRTDVYSLGATMYEALAGRPPFRGKNHADTLSQIIERDPVGPKKVNPRVPKDLETIVLKCLRKDPVDRYGTAEALGQDLRRFVRGDPIEARSQGRWQKLARWAWRLRRRVAASGILLVLLGLTGGIHLQKQRAENRLRQAEYMQEVAQAVEMVHFGRLSTGFEREGGRRVDPMGFFVPPETRRRPRERAQDPVAEAVEKLGASIAKVPEKPDAYLHRARALLLLDDEEGALRDLDEAIARDREFVPARLLRASIFRTRGQLDAAEAEMVRARQSREEWGEAWITAQTAADEHRWTDIARACSALIDRYREGDEVYIGASAEIHILRGKAFLRTRRFRAAIRDFAVAEDRWREALDPVLLEAEAYYRDGAPEEAERVLSAFYARTSFKTVAALGAALRYYYLQANRKALEWADRIEDGILRDRTRVPILVVQGRALSAVIAGENVLRADPGDLVVCGALIWAHMARWDVDRALEVAERAFRLDSGDLWANLGLGWTLGWKGKLEEAIEYLSRSTEIQETHAGRRMLAAAYFVQGDATRASEAVEQGLELLRRGGSAVHSLDVAGYSIFVPILEHLGEYDGMFDLHRRILEVVPGHWETHRQLIEFVKNDPPLSSAAALDSFLDRLAAAVEKDVACPRCLETGAFLLAHHPAEADLAGALAWARLAVEKSGGRSARALRTLADVLSQSEDYGEAVVALEKAIEIDGRDPIHRVMLSECRRADLPRIASYETVDALLFEGEKQIVVENDAKWRFLKGTREPSENREWTRVDFDDSSWTQGSGPFGDGLSCSRTRLDDMVGRYTTVYARHLFKVDDPGIYRHLWLRVEARDGFVAYLNGEEIGRAGAGGPGTHIPHDGSAAEILPREALCLLSIDTRHLRASDNCLALQGLNHRDCQPFFYLAAALIGEVRPRPAEGRKLVEAYRQVADTFEARNRLLYLEAREAQKEGNHARAIELLAGLATRDPETPLPHLRRAEILRAGGKFAEAEEGLRRILPSFPERKELWELWHEIVNVNLHLPLEDVLSTWEAGELRGYGADLWGLWEPLAAGGRFRMDCGGGEYTGAGGETWARDRFFTGGRGGRARVEMDEALDRDLYRSQRSFPYQGNASQGYRIPLPPGHYRIALHFAETRFLGAGRRRFTVLVEGERVLEAYDPGTRGFAVPHSKVIRDTRVTDGYLDIVFVQGLANPVISALEIERVERP
jgi:tetratricopeptide (TPR) repeat protein